MRSLPITILFILLSSNAACAQQKSSSILDKIRVDKNKDGRLSADELGETASSVLLRFDKDGDGELSKQEIQDSLAAIKSLDTDTLALCIFLGSEHHF